MKITTEEFVSSFHSLSGTTIGERRKNLYNLLNNTADSPNVDFTSIQPKTPLEESFKVEILIYHKNIPQLINVLKSENPILIEKVLKVSSWFLENLLQHLKGELLVKELFPALSFNTKVKLINKLALNFKNTEQADGIFYAIKEKYGLYLASKLLPCCGKDVIVETLRLAKIELTCKQLLAVVKKHPQLTEQIFEALSRFQAKSTIAQKYKTTFKFIMQNDALLFLKLYKEYKPCIRLGWRTTDKIVLRNKQNIIKNAQEFYQVLHSKQVVKRLVATEDFNQFYVHMFPKTTTQLKDNFNFYLDLMPSGVNKLDLLLTTFRKKYDNELWDEPTLITPGVLEIMTPDEREAWMLTNPKPNDMSQDVWLCLMKVNKSIPALKQRISLTSELKERAELVACLVETCRINNDKTALASVCKYMTTQHRNDSNSVLYCFLKTLRDCFCLDNLDDEHWKYITEITELFLMRKEIPYYYNEWKLPYVQYRIEKQLPIKDEVKNLMTKLNFNTSSTNLMKRQHRKVILLALNELIPEVYKGDDLKNQYVEYLHCVVNWNRRYPKDQISLLSQEGALNALREQLKDDKSRYSYMADLTILSLLRTRIDENLKREFLNILVTREQFSVDMELMEWLIKYEPLTIVSYIDFFTKAVLNLWYTQIHSFFWKCCGNYNHLEIPQIITTTCLDIINKEDESESNKKNAISALSCLMPSEEFLKLIVPYYPSDLIMDVNDEENQETYKIQQAITASLKNVIPPSSSLDSVQQFIKGDYLKFIQRSLHSVSHSVPEEKLIPFFTSLIDRPVSVRKHAIYLTFKVLDKTEIYCMLTKFMATEKNPSIRKFLFKGTFKYFVTNPDDHWWKLVKQNIKAVDLNDQEAFEALIEIPKLPPSYLVKYITFTWQFLEALPNLDNKYVEGKCRLLDAVTPTVIPYLTNEFCLAIIDKYFLKSKELSNFQKQIYSFTCKFVIYAVSELEQEERLKYVFEIIKNYVRVTWHETKTKTEGRNLIFNFLQEFCSYFIEKKCHTKNSIVKFVDLWNNFLKPSEAFHEYLYLQFTLIYADFQENFSLGQIGEKLTKLCDSLFSSYGGAVANVFCSSLNSYVDHFLNAVEDVPEDNRYILIESIIAANSSTNCLIVAVSLLPRNVPTTKNKLSHNRIIRMFQQNPDPLIQLALCSYLSSSEGYDFDIPSESKRKRKANRFRGRHKQPIFINEFSSKYKK